MRIFLLLLAIAALATAATALSGDGTTVFTSASQQVPVLSVVAFSLSDSAPQEGQDVGFTLVLTNRGDMVTDAHAQVRIFDSAYHSVAAFNYTNLTIGRGETLTLTKAWSTGGTPPGSYTAFANVSYDGTVTNTLFSEFRIRPQSQPANMTLAPDISVMVLPQPPTMTLSPPDTALLAYPILKEMSPGDNALIFPLFENRGPAAIYVNAAPAGPNAALSSPVTGVLLPPGKPTSLVIPVQVPRNAPVGYYALQMQYSLNGSNISQPLIIHVVPSPAAGLAIYREITIDRQNNDSVMQINAVNKGSPLGHAEVFEQVPSAFDLSEVRFIVPPTALGKSLIRWDLVNVPSNETRTLSYVLPGIPGNPGLFSIWPPAQTLVIEPVFYRNILVGGFEAPVIGPGEKGDYMLRLFNSGPSDDAVAVEITGAAGWQLEPHSFNVSIPSRATSDLDFVLEAPADASDPVYPFTVHLDYAGIRDQKTLLVPLNHENVVALPQSSFSQQLRTWVVRNASLLALAALACVALAMAVRWGYVEFRKPRYDKKRVEGLMKIQQMFGDGGKKE